MKGENAADLKAAIERLTTVRSQLGSEIYQAAGGPGAGGGEGASGSGAAVGQARSGKSGDGPVEADYEVVE